MVERRFLFSAFGLDASRDGGRLAQIFYFPGHGHGPQVDAGYGAYASLTQVGADGTPYKVTQNQVYMDCPICVDLAAGPSGAASGVNLRATTGSQSLSRSK